MKDSGNLAEKLIGIQPSKTNRKHILVTKNSALTYDPDVSENSLAPSKLVPIYFHFWKPIIYKLPWRLRRQGGGKSNAKRYTLETFLVTEL